MASTFRYVSVLTPPKANVNVVFTFSQRNVVESSFTSTVELTSGMTEDDVAQAIKDQFNADFITNNAAYDKIPMFSRDGYPPFTLVAVDCDHTVHVWSQVGFNLDVTSPEDPNAPLLEIRDIPIFPTVQDWLDLGPQYGLVVTDANGDPLPSDVLSQAMRICSAKVIELLHGFKVVASTYVQEERGNYKLGYKLDVWPVLYEDRPIVRGPYFSILTNQSDIAPIVNYDIDYQDGLVSFPNYGSYQRQPLDINNVLKQTYVAGFANVPDVCKQVAVQIGSFLNYNPAISELKQGVFTVRYRDLEKIRLEMQVSLNQALGR